jgi:hypothetical protein
VRHNFIFGGAEFEIFYLLAYLLKAGCVCLAGEGLEQSPTPFTISAKSAARRRDFLNFFDHFMSK